MRAWVRSKVEAQADACDLVLEQGPVRFATRLSGVIVLVAVVSTVLAHVVLDQLGLLPYRLGPALAVGVGVSTLVSGSVGFITLLSVARAIQALATNRDKFRRLSATDDLSGLLNRRAFFAAMHQAPEASLILFDIDNFKTINDRHGHAAGDAAIRSIGRLLGSAPDAIAGRLGGEEFGVLLPGQDLANAWRTAERLRVGVARLSVKTPGAVVTLTVSGGVAAAEAGQGVDELYRRCDGFLYAAKAHGRNRVLAALPDEPLRACA
ncbi:GGDEF domain-containing protein [Lichenihabitans sp. Uapishka_5]|uniref:GGDEF domain-containing protein n=1 Tax=Lichenihabitans sp. Uapishka_5 TaxID=3037302 RepID=UPI0029E7E207|nr:GGDEF domain-containing protein [Lichenihabitans sp. Uapishka_5]MDX7952684.1 GGDEF domain-containing protein [Lichenihabitans sp. Uapishka_5]